MSEIDQTPPTSTRTGKYEAVYQVLVGLLPRAVKRGELATLLGQTTAPEKGRLDAALTALKQQGKITMEPAPVPLYATEGGRPYNLYRAVVPDETQPEHATAQLHHLHATAQLHHLHATAPAKPPPRHRASEATSTPPPADIEPPEVEAQDDQGEQLPCCPTCRRVITDQEAGQMMRAGLLRFAEDASSDEPAACEEEEE